MVMLGHAFAQLARYPAVIISRLIFRHPEMGEFKMDMRRIRTLRILAAGAALTSLALAGGTAGTGASRQDLGAAAAVPHLAAYAASVTPSAGHKTWAYVANYGSGTVTPINTATNKASSQITV